MTCRTGGCSWYDREASWSSPGSTPSPAPPSPSWRWRRTDARPVTSSRSRDSRSTWRAKTTRRPWSPRPRARSRGTARATRLDPDEVWADPGALFAIGHAPAAPSVRPQTAYGSGPSLDLRRRVVRVRRPVAVGRDPGRTARSEAALARGRVSVCVVEHHGRPAFDTFGLSVTSFGQFGWLSDRSSGRIWRL